jgi:hypothetical protein
MNREIRKLNYRIEHLEDVNKRQQKFIDHLRNLLNDYDECVHDYPNYRTAVDINSTCRFKDNF